MIMKFLSGTALRPYVEVGANDETFVEDVHSSL
jgi:hypothetical protein